MFCRLNSSFFLFFTFHSSLCFWFRSRCCFCNFFRLLVLFHTPFKLFHTPLSFSHGPNCSCLFYANIVDWLSFLTNTTQHVADDLSLNFSFSILLVHLLSTKAADFCMKKKFFFFTSSLLFLSFINNLIVNIDKIYYVHMYSKRLDCVQENFENKFHLRLIPKR